MWHHPKSGRTCSKRMDIVQRLNDEINFVERSQKEVTADIVEKHLVNMSLQLLCLTS